MLYQIGLVVYWTHGSRIMNKRAAWWIISISMALTVGAILVGLLPYAPFWTLLAIGIASGVGISVIARKLTGL